MLEAIFIDACLTQSILVILYAAITVKMLRTTRLDFILVIAALLSVSCVTWISVCYCKWQEAHSNGQGYRSAASILWFINLISYDFALWMFAMRYWVLSKVLGLIV